MKFPVALSLLVLAFAGCTGSGAKDEVTISGDDFLDNKPILGVLPGEPVLDLDAGVPVPVWSVGDWWSYNVEYLGALPKTYDAKIVVYAEDSEAWYLTSDNREMILRAGFNHYPTLGKVKKSDLGEFIHGQEVAFFAWPMKNGTGTARFRDFDAAWSVSFGELDTGKGKVPGFSSVMRRTSDDAVILRHGYSPVAKWFTNLSFSYRGGEPVDVQFTLQDWGTNYTGEVPVVTIVDKVHRMFPIADAAALAAPTTQATESVTVAEGSSVLLGMFYGGAPGHYEFAMRPQGYVNEGHGEAFTVADPGVKFWWVELANARAGTWLGGGGGATNGPGFVFGEMYELHDETVTLPPA